MTTQDIKNEWTSLGEDLNPLTSDRIDLFGLQPETIDFLKNCGFPFQCAPFLSFVKNSKHDFENINRLSDLYNLPASFDKLISIGSDGSGNPIVINTLKNDRIELLDHEQDFEPIALMNKNVQSLALCLIAYKKFVETILSENGSKAYLNSNFSDVQFDNLKNQLLSLDNDSAKSGFWAMELQELKVNRDYYQKNPD